MKQIVSYLLVFAGTAAGIMWITSEVLELSIISPLCAVAGCGLIIAGCVAEGAA